MLLPISVCGNNTLKMIDNTSALIQKLELLTDELIINKKVAKEARLEFDQIFTHSNMAISIVNEDGTFLKTNDKLEKMLGYSKEELRELTYQDITHKDDLYIDMTLAHGLMSRQKKAYSMVKRYIKKNGNVLWVLLMVTKVPDTKGNLKYYLAQILDLTGLLPVLNTSIIAAARKEGDSKIGIWEQ